MKLYELTYLISSEVSEEEPKSLPEKVNTLIQKVGGVLIETKPPIKTLLPKPIKNKKEVFLVISNFNSEPEKLEVLEKELGEESKILRHLILVKTPTKISVVRARPRRKVRPEVSLKEKKVELGEIEKKLEEILGE